MVFCGMQAIARTDMYVSVNSGSRQKNTTATSSGNGRQKTAIGTRAISSVRGYCESFGLPYNQELTGTRSVSSEE